MVSLPKVLFWGGLGAWLTASNVHASTGEAHLVLTSEENGTVPQENYECDGRIHGYLRLPERAAGTHVLESRWISPTGRVAADSLNPVTFDPPGRSTAYVWFSFPERRGPFRLFDSKSDEAKLSYNGT